MSIELRFVHLILFVIISFCQSNNVDQLVENSLDMPNDVEIKVKKVLFKNNF